MKNITEFILESKKYVDEFMDYAMEHADGMLGDNSDEHWCNINKIKNGDDDELNYFVNTVMQRTCNINEQPREILDNKLVIAQLKKDIKKLIIDEY